MEFVSPVVGPVVESLMVPVKRHLGYLFSSTENVRTMNARMKQLDGKSVDIMKHKDKNDMNTLEVPAGVPSWLEEVATIKRYAQSISSNDSGSCFNLKARYQVGRKSWKTTKEIERLHKEGLDLEIGWSDAQKPLARVNTKRASTSAPSRGDDFKSRDMIFEDALMFLQQDHKTQVIALCGMGGVGKTTVMEQLKKFAEDTKMFDWIVKVVLGKQPKTFSIQQAVAENLGHSLTETIEETRAERLRKRFEQILEKSKKGTLVILDDVWGKVELKDVGLSPLPSGVKLLLTSRYEDLCTSFAVEAGNLYLKVLKVDVLEETEAHKFFCQITEISVEHDPELYQISGEIVKKCSYLPLAIKLIASTLKSENKSIWRDRLLCLKKDGPDPDVHEIINLSSNYLKKEEAKEIFLLCGLFPEDSNILIEDLTRYAWGLQLLNGVSNLEDARDRTEACVSHLKNAHLLIDNDEPRCVKLHDLVLDFVLATVSKGDRASLIKHGDVSTWSPVEMSESYRRISLSCKGLPEFPKGFKSPNLSLLKLMNRDDSFSFPEDFYGNIEKLEVMAYQNYPLHSRLLQYSTNLRTLCLHQCLLMFDCSFIGNLVNLEVLSFSHSTLRELPSSVGNLKKLKLLDLTGCSDLKINDGVLKNLVKLEEIYMRDIGFTERNSNELAGHSKNLFALEIKCFENQGQLKNMSYENLKRFKIYMGNFNHDWEDKLKLFGNKLYLVTNKVELLESGMNGLLEKTEELCLEVDGMTNLEDIEVKSLHYPQYSSFCNLRSFMVSKCAELSYIFTLRVATALSKLEHLEISACHSMQELIHIESSGSETIKFPKLKFLSLLGLPNLLSLCNTINAIELPLLMELKLSGLPKFTSIYPKKNLATSSMAIKDSAWQPFLNEEVVVPKLEKLCIYHMKNLKEIWPCQYSSSKEADVCILREIYVDGCDSLVNLFPSNPMTLLHHLEDLEVVNCGSVEVLFDIDLECVGKIEEFSSCLRSITVLNLKELREVWRIKGANNSGLPIHGFEAVEIIEIQSCKRFRNVFSPTNTNFNMGALKRVAISDCRESGRNNELLKSSQQQEIDVISNEEIPELGDIISTSIVFPSYLIHTFHHVQTFDICNSYEGAMTVFEIDSPSSRELATNHVTQQLTLLPYLEDIHLEGMDCLSHVWKCNWNEFLIIQKQQPKRSFHNLTTMFMSNCRSIKYLFSPLMAELLCNLQKVDIYNCDVIEEVVSNKNEEVEERITYASTNTSTNVFPRLDSLFLLDLPNLKHIGGGGTKGGSNELSFNNTTTTIPIHDQFQFSHEDVSWSLCQCFREIHLGMCQALSSAIPFNAVGQMQKLEELTIDYCDSLEEVFETTNFDEGSDTTLAIPRPKNINVPQLSSLKKLDIDCCDLLQHVFTFATLVSLSQLHELTIKRCKAVKVIVKEEADQEQTTPPKVVVFRRLKSIALVDLPTLTGFFLGMNEFRWPLLDEVKIAGCPKMEVFTYGCSSAPKLNGIHTNSGKYSLDNPGLNFHVMPNLQQTHGTGSHPTTSRGIPWSFHNLIEIDMKHNYDVKKIIPSKELLQVQKLERIRVESCYLVEVFEALEDSGLSDLPFVVKIPKLRELELIWLDKLKYIWKSNPWIVLEFPNLTKVTIGQCCSLEYVFSSSMVGSLLQLQHLHINHCRSMEVIVKEENVVIEEDEEECDTKIILPRLKSLQLYSLPRLKGCYLGKEAFSWPSLDTLKIWGCPAITVFTKGHSETPKLKVIHINFVRCAAEEDDINSFIMNRQEEGLFDEVGDD